MRSAELERGERRPTITITITITIMFMNVEPVRLKRLLRSPCSGSPDYCIETSILLGSSAVADEPPANERAFLCWGRGVCILEPSSSGRSAACELCVLLFTDDAAVSPRYSAGYLRWSRPRTPTDATATSKDACN